MSEINQVIHTEQKSREKLYVDEKSCHIEEEESLAQSSCYEGLTWFIKYNDTYSNSAYSLKLSEYKRYQNTDVKQSHQISATYTWQLLIS